LTSYLADHLLSETRGDAVGYRRNILQGYADFVSTDKDFSLREFRSRHSDSTQAVGYGKAQMLFHMLRQELGDDLFRQGLQKFYAEQKFKVAGYTELLAAFSAVSERDLSGFLKQWVDQVGAPQLSASQVKTIEVNKEWKFYLTLEQIQDGPAYELNVPIAITLRDEPHARQRVIHMDQKEKRVVLTFKQEPIRLDIDPEFDLFRRADYTEIPAALSLAYGSIEALMVLPFKADKEEVREYFNLITQWRMTMPVAMETVYDNEIDALPTDKTVWVMGWKNRFVDELAPGFEEQGIEADQDKVTLGTQMWNSDEHSIVLAQRQEKNPKLARIWLAAHKPDAIAGLARKLPHYRKYSYLMFTGEAPDNKVKGQWQIHSSPLSFSLKKGAVMGKLAPRSALVE